MVSRILKSNVFNTPETTRAWAQTFAKTLRATSTLALLGPLGAGKTTLIQGLAKGWGCREPVRSPTFALVNEYRSPRGPMYHMDMYRLSAEEAQQFPLEDYLGQGLCVIEWADRVQSRLPKRVTALRLEILNDSTRRLTIGRL